MFYKIIKKDIDTTQLLKELQVINPLIFAVGYDYNGILEVRGETISDKDSILTVIANHKPIEINHKEEFAKLESNNDKINFLAKINGVM